MRKIFCLLALVVLTTGCATESGGLLGNLLGGSAANRQLSFVNYNKSVYPPQTKDYPIDLFFGDKPQKPYEVIGEVMGYVIRDSNLRPLLETKARNIGADGLMDIQTSLGSRTDTDITQESVKDAYGNTVGTMPVSETTSQKVINIKAKAIKYK